MTEPAFDYLKVPDHSKIHPLVEICNKADELLSGIIAVADSGKNEVSSAYFNLQNKFVEEKLKYSSLSLIDNGIDVSSLKKEGITSLYDLLHCQKPEVFKSLPFAQSSALQSRAKLIEQSWKDKFSLKIVPRSQDEDMETIVAITAQLIAVAPYYDEAKKLYESIHQKLQYSIPFAEIDTPRLVWLLHYTTNLRKEIWSAIQEVEEIANSPILSQAQQLQKNCIDAVDRCFQTSYWDDFETNSAPYYSFLESLVGTPKNTSSPLGFNYCSEAPLNPISGETTTQSTYQPSNPSQLGIPSIPSYSSDSELAELERSADILVQSVNKYPLNLSLMTSRLRTYQQFAAKYILHQRQVLLGDEMGLGKTVEAIASIAHLAASGETHFMVVCPASVLVNWSREIDKHSRKLAKWKLHGPDTQSNYYLWKRYGGIALTTFDMLKKLQPPERESIGLFIVDEAHTIKNPRAARTHAVLNFKKTAKRSLFMTGTPMENKIQEMIFLIRCLRPDIANLVDNGDENPDATKFRLKIAPVYLRRIREDVLTELPEKEEIEDWCTMNQTEEKEYQLSLAIGTYMSIRRLSWNLPDLTYSTKMDKLKEICDDAFLNKRKVLVFSFFKDTLRVIQKILGRRCYGPITGEVSTQMRQKIIDDFTRSSNGSVLLCQILAGGVGLNIQAASVVIFCEPQWKPSLEEQAVSRAYRMGQSHKVFVHRILMEDTIDEYVFAVMKGKAKDFELFANISESGLASMSELKLMNDIINYEAKRLGVTRTVNG